MKLEQYLYPGIVYMGMTELDGWILVLVEMSMNLDFEIFSFYYTMYLH